jgi:hypothetical protein
MTYFKPMRLVFTPGVPQSISFLDDVVRAMLSRTYRDYPQELQIRLFLWLMACKLDGRTPEVFMDFSAGCAQWFRADTGEIIRQQHTSHYKQPIEMEVRQAACFGVTIVNAWHTDETDHPGWYFTKHQDMDELPEPRHPFPLSPISTMVIQ